MNLRADLFVRLFLGGSLRPCSSRGRAGWRWPAAWIIALGSNTLQAAVIEQRIDAAAATATIDGTLGVNEYGPANSYSFSGGGTGLGGVLNGAGRVLMNSSDTTLAIAFSPGAALDHHAVIYLDTRAGGFSDATLNDTSDADRSVVSSLGAAGDDGFPFAADFALLVNSNGCTLFELSSGALTVVPTTASCVAAATPGLREVAVPLAALGISSGGGAIDFFAAYCRSDLFNSNETIPPMPAINGAPNPGTTATVNYTEQSRFIAFNPNPRMVINQIYGGGGNTGAIYATDFVELYNPGPGYTNMVNWSLQYASSSGATWNVTSLNGLVSPGGYFLVTFASGGHGVGVSPISDRVGSASLSATDGKLALCNSTAGLTGGPDCPFPGNVIDFVGYGAANRREPCTGTIADNATSPSNALAIHRRGCGGQDTGDNNSDWSIGLPSPRNSQTPPTVALGLTALAQPYVARSGGAVRLQASLHECVSGAPLATTGFVTVNLTAIGGEAEVVLRDDGSGGDERAADGIYSTLSTIGAVSEGSKWLPVRATDGVRSAAGYIGVLVSTAIAPANDNCSAATVIPGPYTTPVDVAGNLTNSNVEHNAVVAISTAPSSAMSTRRGQWFRVTGSGNTLSASLCPTSPAFDSVMLVLCGTCDGLSVVASSDDVTVAECATPAQAGVSWCSQPAATYFIWIAPLSIAAPTQLFTLRISDDGLSCSGAASCELCTPAVAGAQREDEPALGPGRNEGCDGTTDAFRDATVGAAPLTFCGTSYGFGDADDADWYRFQAGQTALFNASLTAQFSGRLTLRRLGAGGTCSGSSVVATSAPAARCAPMALSAALTEGEWYAIRVNHEPTPTQIGGVSPGATSANYCLTLQLGVAPANDLCSGAQTLIFGAPPVAGTTRDAAADVPASCDPAGRDVWYRVSTTRAGLLRVDTCGAGIDTALAIFSGACDALTEIACNDDCGGAPCGGPAACVTSPVVPAGVYFIRVSDRLIANGGAFQIAARFELENDACANAIAILPDSTIAGTTVGAALDADLPACSGPLGPGGGGSFVYSAGAVWYRLTPSQPGTITLDTLTNPAGGGGFDTRLTVFSGNCGALTCITANDDIDGASLRSRVAFAAQPAIDYYVLVHGFGAVTGNFQLTSTFQPTPANDNCDSSQELTGQTGALGGTTRGATCPAFTPAGFPSCNTTYGFFDVWYQYTPTCSGTLTLDTCGGFDTLLSVHSECPTATDARQVAPFEASCNRDGPVGCAPGSQLTVELSGGQTYRIRVAGQNGAAPGGNFTLRYLFTPRLPVAPVTISVDRTDFCAANPDEITLSSTGGGGTTLAWYADGCGAGAPVATGTPATLASPAQTTRYFARWETDCGASDCESILVTVTAPPTIVEPPQPLTLCAGATAGFGVTPGGTAPFAFQWRRDGVDIPGADTDTLTLSPLTPADAGDYSVLVTNGCGSATSAAATLVVRETATITTPPQSQGVCDGGSVTLSVVAEGLGPISYQWRRGGADVPGATMSTLMLASVTDTTAGSYTVVITNPCGSITSPAAVITLDQPPTVTDQPDDAAACVGGAVDFTLVASGEGALSYQWRRDGADISGATSATLSIPAAQPADAGPYTCAVTNSCGTTISAVATLTVGAGPLITQAPQSLTRCVGASAEFAVVVSGTPPLTYQWSQDGAPIEGASQSVFTIASVQSADGGAYTCAVGSACGTTTSAAATLTVLPAPQITQQPQGRTVCAGAAVELSVVIDAPPPVTFAWERDGLPIQGAVSATLTLAAAAATDAGAYRCRIGTACGEILSDAASLIVETAPTITQPPLTQTVCSGAAATFTVTAAGTPPLSYQWLRDAVAIDGATAHSYAIAAVGPRDLGAYACRVTNGCGTVTSASAALEIVASLPAPTTTSVTPAALCQRAAGSITLTAGGGGSVDATLRWYQGGCGGTEVGSGSPLTIDAPSGTTSYFARWESSCAASDCGSATFTRDAALRGDSDGSGAIDFNDIGCFVSAVIDAPAWGTCGTTHAPGSYLCVNDVDGSGAVDFDDIGVFVACLVSGACP